MKTTEYVFNGQTYVCRIVLSNEGEELIIGSTSFLDAIQPGDFEDENEGFANKDAEKIYDEIFSFIESSFCPYMLSILMHQRNSIMQIAVSLMFPISYYSYFSVLLF